MGITWCAISFDGVDRNEAKRLIELQSLTLRAEGIINFSLEDISEKMADQNDYARVQSLSPHPGDALKELLDFNPAEDDCESFKTSVIDSQIIYPFEWRLESYRSILPEELPQYLSLWRKQSEKVSQGKYKDYVLAAYLHVQSKKAQEYWHLLLETLDHVSAETEKWAIELAKSELIEEIKTTEPPTLYPLPVWEELKNQYKVTEYHSDPRYIRQQKEHGHLAHFSQKWCEAVPKPWTLEFWPTELEWYLEWGSEDQWLGEFLKWLEIRIEKNEGLYLYP